MLYILDLLIMRNSGHAHLYVLQYTVRLFPDHQRKESSLVNYFSEWMESYNWMH